LRKKSNFIDAIVCDSQSKFQNITTRRILDLNRDIRIGYLTTIPWVLEVLENLGRIHWKNCTVTFRFANWAPSRVDQLSLPTLKALSQCGMKRP